jgi:flagellar biosynthesis component FlhA
MFILSILPDWVFHTICLAGVLGIIAGFLLAFIPVVNKYKLPIQVISLLMFAFGLYMEGAMSNEQAWQLRVKEVETKLAKAEAESAKENTKIVTKIITQKEYIQTRGRDIIQYVDKEIVKYDSKFAIGGVCEIPKEFIKAHNDAAQEPKK